MTKKPEPMADTIKNEDGIVLCDGEHVKQRWQEYCTKLYQKNSNIPPSPKTWQEPDTTEPPPLIEEFRRAISELKNDKSPGTDEITAELIKHGGEDLVNFYHQLCNKIWTDKTWPDDWLHSEFVSLPKKGDTQLCSNERTIALISHGSKILLKIIAERMKIKLQEEVSEEQCGFRPGKGTRNQILNLKMIIEKNRERGQDLFLCFIDYSKAFDTVVHEKLWNGMHVMSFPTHIITLLKNMYDQQKAAVRTACGNSEWLKIGQGVRQGCTLFPHLFNIYSESIM